MVQQRSAATQSDSNAPASGWVSMSRACKALGVNESTLRRWANEGRIPSFRTPGGHRRFAEADLQSLQSPSVTPPPLAHEYRSLGALAVARIRRRLQRGSSHEASWYTTVDEEGRSRFRPLGRRLAALAEECLQKGSRKGRLIDEARAIGRQYGQELARGGVPLHDAVEAFTFFRRTLDETTRQLAHREHLSAEDAASAWEQVSGLADVVLVAMVEAFDAPRAAT